MKKTLTFYILLLSFLHSGVAVAKDPKIIVSIPPIHSLVASLMEGAGEPTLLFDKNLDQEAALDPFQKGHVITADMVVWVGPGLETPLEQTLNDMPILRNRLMTLSQFLPLLSLPGTDSNGIISSRDLSFWTDPRLAIMAVRNITPRLVRVDPDNQELYLNNEITLIKKLKNLEAEISAELIPYANNPQLTVINNDRYFAHRFLAYATTLTGERYSFLKVSATNSVSCSATVSQSKKLSAGPEYYFDVMRLNVSAIKACIKKTDNNMAFNNLKYITAQ